MGLPILLATVIRSNDFRADFRPCCDGADQERRYCDNVGIWTRAIAVIGSQPIIIGRIRVQPGNTLPGRIADVQILVPWYVTIKRTARGHI